MRSLESSLWDRLWYAVVGALGTLQAFILERVIDQRCWRSSDGRVWRLCDMTDRHLGNVHAMLVREGEIEGIYWAVRAEVQAREDAA